MFDLRTVIRPNILTLEPYRCARDDFKEGILLDANENTHGPSLNEQTEDERDLELNRYPDPHQIELKTQIVDYRNSNLNENFQGDLITAKNLCLGVGSDESIDMLMRCVCTPSQDKMITCPPTYGMYSVCATVNDIKIETVPLLTPDFQIDIDGLITKIKGDSKFKLIYLTSPGNPTAKLLKVDDIISLLNQAQICWNGLIVVDEAYIDFTDPKQSMCTLVNQFPNLVVLQTLSKAFGLAGIRLGVSYSSIELSHYLNSMKYPYSISSLTSNVALRATNKQGLAQMQKSRQSIIEQRKYLLTNLQKLPGIGENIGGLDSNFLLIQILNKNNQPCNDTAFKLYTKLATENQVVVRFRGKELNCTGALRISVGTPSENQILIEKFQKCLNEIQ